MKIGSCEIGRSLSLAPMAGYSDRGMRRLCYEHGADYSVSEMISAKAVVFGDKKTFALSEYKREDGPIGLQIFGSEPNVLAEAARILTERTAAMPPLFIDVNMGCPVHKIFSNGEGSALMKDPLKIETIVSAITKNTSLPVTVKIRKGVDNNSVNAVDCALAAEAGGASMVCVHGRTRVQMYGGYSDRKIIEKVKSCLHIPVIANGDVVDSDSALSLLADTGADGIAIGRGAVGNPFIFEEIKAAIEKREYLAPSVRKRAEIALLQLKYAIEDKGERLAVTEARKQIALYLKGFKGASSIRGAINSALTYKEVEEIIYNAIE